MFSFRVDGKPEASEHDDGPLLQKRMKEVLAMIAGRRRHNLYKKL